MMKSSFVTNQFSLGLLVQSFSTSKRTTKRSPAPPGSVVPVVTMMQTKTTILLSQPSTWEEETYKLSWRNIVRRYQSANASKLYDIEELIDYYFHRRLAAVIAVIVSYLPFVVTPNQITLFGLVLGWASAFCLYDAHFETSLDMDPQVATYLSAVLMFAWIVSDCADGQVARLCKRGTRTGRILDGVVDGLVILPNMFVLGLVTSKKYDVFFGQGFGIYFATVSGFSLCLHALVYDRVKNVYMENVMNQSECDGETSHSVRLEFHEARRVCVWSLDTALLGIYFRYLQLQDTFTVPARGKQGASSKSRQAILDYKNKFSMVARLATFLGISAHVTGLYTAYLLSYEWFDALIAVQLYFVFVLNAICMLVMLEYWRSGMHDYKKTK